MYKAKEILDDKYEVIALLGEGGFGQVFQARDLLLQDRYVAIKVLRLENSSHKDDLIQEMEFLTRLDHPQIVSFYHYFTYNGRLHLVMEYCAGGSLWQVIKKAPKLDVNSVMQWGVEIADVLGFVHSKGIVHHDIKPGNVLLTANRKLKIGDFGVANRALGTLVYMPPEVFFEGYPSTNDPRADIYALGITLLELLRGENPLFDVNTKDLLSTKLRHDFIAGDIPRWVQDVLLKATHPTPEMRFQTMTDFKEAMLSKTVPFVMDQKRMIADDLAEKADALIKKKKWKDASKFIDQALYCCSDSVKALSAAGRLRIRMNRFGEAQDFFNKALRLNTRAEVQKELGWISLDRGSYPQALSMLSDYLHRNSSDYEAINLLIQCYYETDRYEQAADLAKSVIGKSPVFRNNWVISQLLAGIIPLTEYADFKTDKNPFLRYNALVATEEPRAWEVEVNTNLKSKLLFQDFRFGFDNSEKNVVSIREGGATREFKGKIIGIGRSESNELTISGSLVSRRHCAVINFPDDVWIYDLNSTTGTFVDNRRITRKQFIVGVHEVRVGNSEFQVASRSDFLL